MPLQRYNTVNSHALLDLEEAFASVAYRAYLEDVTMAEGALIEAPDLLLAESDQYMASVIGRVAENHRNIMVLCGYGQTRTLPYYLYYSQKVNSSNCLEQVTKYSPVYSNIVRQDNQELTVDKLVILDSIYNNNKPEIDKVSMNLIRGQIARQGLGRSKKYDAQFMNAQRQKLINLYSSLHDKKYKDML